MAVKVKEIREVDLDDDQGLLVFECPGCNALFGVDWTFIEQVFLYINCPMCKMELDIDEE